MPINPFGNKSEKAGTIKKATDDSEAIQSDKEKLNEIIQITEPKYVLDDLILPAETETQLLDFLSYKDCERQVFLEWGLASTHNFGQQVAVNFYGEPGTGKTMAAHAVASYLQKPLILVNYADVESKYVGETAKNICDIFRVAKEKNAIIFFDEADAILSRRVNNMSHATDVSVNQTRSVLLMLLNDYSGLVIFATNFIENYDSAFMRRILSHIEFCLPDMTCRRSIWAKYIPTKLPVNVNISKLVDSSDGLSGSDISNCVLKAAMAAARSRCSIVTEDYFLNAIKEIKKSKLANEKNLMGSTLTSSVVTDDYVRNQLINNTIEAKNGEGS